VRSITASAAPLDSAVPGLHRHNLRKFEKWYDQIEPLGSEAPLSLKG
jgi:hypothetical protein